MESINWGILSTAAIGRKQVIPAIQRSANGTVAAIASRGEKAKDAAAEMGIEKAYSDYESLLADPEIQAVYIPLPNSLHKEWVLKAAEAGKHILCEKPAALNAEELQEMIDVCTRHDVFFMEAFMYQFHPQHAIVKKLIHEGRIGKVSTVNASFSFLLEAGKENIRMDKDLGGGALYDVGCYCIHSMSHVLEETPAKVYAHAQYHDQLNVDTTTAGTVTFPSGIEGLFDCSFETFPRNRYEVVGSQGSIEVNNAYRPDQNPDGNGIIRITDSDGNLEEHEINGDQYTLQVEHFADSIIENKQPSYSNEKMLAHAKTLDAVRRSISEGQAVRL